LTAGIVIHAAHGEQDMRRLGGLSKDIPLTCFMFAVGGLSLAGVPIFSGFFSKEAILHAVHHHNGGMLLFSVGAGAAILTAFYTGRAFFMTFYGSHRVEHPHLPGGPTTLSCLVLTVLATVAGFFHERLSKCFDPTQQSQGFLIEPGVTSPAAIVLTLLVLLAIAAAYAMYGRDAHDKLGRNSTFLNFARGGFGFDDAYRNLAAATALVARLTARGIDSLLSVSIPELLGRSFVTMGTSLRETQSGQTRHYVVSIVLSVVAFLMFSRYLGGRA